MPVLRDARLVRCGDLELLSGKIHTVINGMTQNLDRIDGDHSLNLSGIGVKSSWKRRLEVIMLLGSAIGEFIFMEECFFYGFSIYRM
jgi:hypothetical protein